MVQILDTTLCSELIFDKKTLVEVNEDATVEQVLQLMNQNNIISVPVFQNKTGKKVYTGIVNNFDIIAYLGFAAYFSGGELITENDLNILEYESVPIKEIQGFSEEGQVLWIFAPTSLLKDVAKLFTNSDKRVHRVLISQENTEFDPKIVFRMLTQTDVVRWIVKNQNHFPITQQKLSDLNLANPVGGCVFQVPENLQTIKALNQIVKQKVHAVAVVDETGKIITTLSESDVRPLCNTNFKKIVLPISEFLREFHDGKLTHPVTCGPTDILLDVAIRAVAAKVHRVWVVDSAERPIGVVTMSDIIAKVFDD